MPHDAHVLLLREHCAGTERGGILLKSAESILPSPSRSARLLNRSEILEWLILMRSLPRTRGQERVARGQDWLAFCDDAVRAPVQSRAQVRFKELLLVLEQLQEDEDAPCCRGGHPERDLRRVANAPARSKP
eukprot:3107707-Prymnesium_polylepis.1